MVPVALSILVVFLISGAVLWVVAGDLDQPTSDEPSPADPQSLIVEVPPVVAAAVAPAAPAVRPRRQATSRRRPTPLAAPTVTEPSRSGPMVASSAPQATVRLAETPLPRHRARSSALLVLLIAVIGVLLAVLIGAVLAALAFALRAAVTS